MISEIRESFLENVMTNEWMDNGTKIHAINKVIYKFD